MNKYTKASLGTTLMIGATSAMAALPVDAQTALDDAKTDGLAAAGLVLTIIVGIFAIKLIRRVL